MPPPSVASAGGKRVAPPREPPVFGVFLAAVVFANLTRAVFPIQMVGAAERGSLGEDLSGLQSPVLQQRPWL